MNRALQASGSNARLSNFLLFNARFSPNLATNIVRCKICREITRGVESLSDNF